MVLGRKNSHQIVLWVEWYPIKTEEFAQIC